MGGRIINSALIRQLQLKLRLRFTFALGLVNGSAALNGCQQIEQIEKRSKWSYKIEDHLARINDELMR